MSQSILICGRNATLLQTRTMVLEHAGFRVRAAEDPFGALGTGEQGVILCSSLTEPEQQEAIRLLRRTCPEARILLVGEDRIPDDEQVFRMSAFAGAENLIENARLLLQ